MTMQYTPMSLVCLGALDYITAVHSGPFKVCLGSGAPHPKFYRSHLARFSPVPLAPALSCFPSEYATLICAHRATEFGSKSDGNDPGTHSMYMA
jgi:hypothetical protein